MTDFPGRFLCAGHPPKHFTCLPAQRYYDGSAHRRRRGLSGDVPGPGAGEHGRPLGLLLQVLATVRKLWSQHLTQAAHPQNPLSHCHSVTWTPDPASKAGVCWQAGRARG